MRILCLIIISILFHESPAKPLTTGKNECGVNNINFGNKILGGRKAEKNEFPWQISVQRYAWFASDFVHICGGTVINDEWVLTAAHCVHNVAEKNFQIRLSAKHTDPFESKVVKVIAHSGYDEDKIVNDIALIKVATKFSTAPNVSSVCLPSATMRKTGFGTITGWGETEVADSSDDLLAVEVPIVANNQCAEVYATKNMSITTDMMCAGDKDGGKDSCYGDSGGPFVQIDTDDRVIITGIVSFGAGCGSPDYPGVYTWVPHYLSWIETNVS